MASKQRFDISIGSEYRVTGHNYENADLDNPTGAIISDIFFLVATDQDGNRFVFGNWRSLEEAESAIADAPPVVLWTRWHPEYGSEAYQRYGQFEELAWERAIDDDYCDAHRR